MYRLVIFGQEFLIPPLPVFPSLSLAILAHSYSIAPRVVKLLFQAVPLFCQLCSFKLPVMDGAVALAYSS